MFYFDEFYGKKVLKSSLLDKLLHFFTTREFVLSEGEMIEFQELALKNRDFLRSNFDIDSANFVTAKQTHSDNIGSFSGQGCFFDNTDALVSDVEGSSLLLNFADCVPVILFVPEKNIVALVHAGWRGTAAKIVKKVVDKIVEDFSIAPSEIVGVIGPAIGKCCFSVKEDVLAQILPNKEHKYSEVYEYSQADERYFVDLKQINRLQLLASGLIKIDVCDYCTCCMSDIFFSYRKESGRTARHSAFVKLEKRN